MNTIKKCRKDLGISQQELAHRAGLAIRTISDLEQGTNGIDGKVKLATLRRLAKALEVPLDSLLEEAS